MLELETYDHYILFKIVQCLNSLSVRDGNPESFGLLESIFHGVLLSVL